MFSILECGWCVEASESLQPQRRGSLADHDVQLLTWDVLLAMLNLTRERHVCSRIEATYWWWLIIHFSSPLEQEVKVTPPGRHVAPTETVSGFTGNFYCHTVSSLHPTVAGCWPLVVLGWYHISSIQVIFHRAQGEEVSLSIHWNGYCIWLN